MDINKHINNTKEFVNENKHIIIPGLVLLIILLLIFPLSRNFLKYHTWDIIHQSSEYFFYAGVKYEENKNISYASGSFRRALKVSKGQLHININDLYQLESLFNLGVIYYQHKKEYPQALHYFYKHMDIYDRIKMNNTNVVNPHEKDIINVINFILALDDTSKKPRAKQLKSEGNKALFKKDYATALKHYNDALKLDPSYVEAYNNIGAIYYYLKDFENAVENWKIVLLFKPDDISMYMNIALAYQGPLKNYKESIYYFEKFIEKVPPDKPNAEKEKEEVRRRIEIMKGMISEKK